jgi:hypothetical protein
MIACFCCHLGWTDIINSLALIHYYKDHFDKIVVFMREDAKGLLQYFIKDMPTIEPIYFPHDILSCSVYGYYLQLQQKCNQPIYPLFFGFHDQYRNDIYRKAFDKSTDFFGDRFYSAYHLDPKIRYEHFIFRRDNEIEYKKYQEVIQDKKDYILVNDTPENPIEGLNKETISLTNLSSSFFDCIMILEKAKEIHAIDSIWSCFCFMIDMKYGILKNVKVVIYCKRGYKQFYKGCEKLPNWTIL